MGFYPAFLDLTKRKCLVVGGGRVALRKVIGLLRAEASVTVVAKKVIPGLSRLADRTTIIERGVVNNDIAAGLALIIGATNDADVNAMISRPARELNIPCNIVDQPRLCSFIVPAVVRRKSLVIAMSTGGAGPMLAREVKARVAAVIGPEYGELTEFLAGLRERVSASVKDPRVRRRFWQSFFEGDPVQYVRDNGPGAMEKRAARMLEEYLAEAKRP